MILTALGADILQDNLAFSESPRMALSKKMTTTCMKVTPQVAHALKERVKDIEEMVLEKSEENRTVMILIDRHFTYNEFIQRQTLKYPELVKQTEIHLTMKSDDLKSSMTLVKPPTK